MVPDNIHTLPMDGHLKFRGLLTKIYKGKYKAKLEIPGGIQMKKPSMGEVWLFSGATPYYNHVIILHVI